MFMYLFPIFNFYPKGTKCNLTCTIRQQSMFLSFEILEKITKKKQHVIPVLEDVCSDVRHLQEVKYRSYVLFLWLLFEINALVKVWSCHSFYFSSSGRPVQVIQNEKLASSYSSLIQIIYQLITNH